MKRRTFLQCLAAGFAMFTGCNRRSGDQGPCRFCKGTGRVACPACDGEGSYPTNPFNESGGMDTCRECSGQGQTKCRMCKGSGKEEPLPFRPPGRPRRVDS
jgi:DnaJ-class molecular chaperone